MYTLHTVCRACGDATRRPDYIKAAPAESGLVPVFDLGLQPLANDFKTDQEEHAGFAPLKVMFCRRCGLGQLSVVVRPDILYADYPYVTSASDTMRKHFDTLFNDIEQEVGNPKFNIVEIGSNDGRLLRHFRDRGAKWVYGVDPAANLARVANDNGIDTLPQFFCARTASQVRDESGLVDLVDVILARHVFCHIDDWHEFERGLEILSSPETLICLEVPDVMHMLDKCEFDTIYHEHLSYFNIGSIQSLLRGTSLHVHRVIHYPIHGGSVLVMLRHKESVKSPGMVDGGIVTEERWRDFASKARLKIDQMRSTIFDLAETHSVCGFGASAKSTVWVNACGFTRKHLKFITDTTPQKLYKFSPGSDIPIVDEGALLRELPDYAVVFAWNYAGEILKEHNQYLERGGRFIIPVPELTIIGKK